MKQKMYETKNNNNKRNVSWKRRKSNSKNVPKTKVVYKAIKNKKIKKNSLINIVHVSVFYYQNWFAKIT